MPFKTAKLNCQTDRLPALPAHLAHALEDQVAVVIHAVGAASERGWQNRSQARGLLAAQVAGVGAVVVMRCSLGAIDAGAPFDHVEIKLQNAALAKNKFCDWHERKFCSLAQERAAGSKEEVFYKLLRDGGGSTGAAALEVALGRDLDLVPVEAVVLVEALVFGGDYGVLKFGRDLVEGDKCVALVVMPKVNPGLQMALNVHGGGRWVDPAGGDERERAERPEGRDGDDEPSQG